MKNIKKHIHQRKEMVKEGVRKKREYALHQVNAGKRTVGEATESMKLSVAKGRRVVGRRVRERRESIQSLMSEKKEYLRAEKELVFKRMEQRKARVKRSVALKRESMRESVSKNKARVKRKVKRILRKGRRKKGDNAKLDGRNKSNQELDDEDDIQSDYSEEFLEEQYEDAQDDSLEEDDDEVFKPEKPTAPEEIEITYRDRSNSPTYHSESEEFIKYKPVEELDVESKSVGESNVESAEEYTKEIAVDRFLVRDETSKAGPSFRTSQEKNFLFNVRQRGYTDFFGGGVKAKSKPGILKLVSAAIRSDDTITRNIAGTSLIKLPPYPTEADGPEFKDYKDRSMLYPDFLVINISIPLGTPSLFDKKSTERKKINAIQMIYIFAIPVHIKNLLELPYRRLCRSHPSVAQLQQIFESGSYPNTDPDMQSRFKVWAKLCNPDLVASFGVPTMVIGFMRRYQGKPCLGKYQTYHSSDTIWPRKRYMKVSPTYENQKDGTHVNLNSVSNDDSDNSDQSERSDASDWSEKSDESSSSMKSGKSRKGLKGIFRRNRSKSRGRSSRSSSRNRNPVSNNKEESKIETKTTTSVSKENLNETENYEEKMNTKTNIEDGGYFEISLDVGQFSYFGRYATAAVLNSPRISELRVMVGIGFEGRCDSELPERILSTVNVDQINIPNSVL
eukprot:g2772.t1